MFIEGNKKKKREVKFDLIFDLLRAKRNMVKSDVGYNSIRITMTVMLICTIFRAYRSTWTLNSNREA